MMAHSEGKISSTYANTIQLKKVYILHTYNIVFLFSVHNIISLLRHEQVHLIRLCLEKKCSRYQVT